MRKAQNKWLAVILPRSRLVPVFLFRVTPSRRIAPRLARERLRLFRRRWPRAALNAASLARLEILKRRWLA